MNELNNKCKTKKLKSQLIQGPMPKLLGRKAMANVTAAVEEIAKLPYGRHNPKAIEIARKYGLDEVPYL